MIKVHEDSGIRLGFLRVYIAGLPLEKQDPTCDDVYTYLKSFYKEKQKNFVEYVREVDANAVAEPNIFVSHPWNASINVLLKSIERIHPKGSDVIVFMDLFCKTDQGMTTPLSYFPYDTNYTLSFIKSAHNIISKTRFSVIYIPCWNEPAGLQRLWCAFEIMVTLLYKGELVLLFPESEEHKLISDVTADPMSFLNFLVKIDSKNATCTQPEDAEVLLEHIASSCISHEMINAKVFRMYLEKYQKAMINKNISANPERLIISNGNIQEEKKKKKSEANGISLRYLYRFIEKHGGKSAFQGKNLHQVNAEFNLVDTAHTKLSHCSTLQVGSDEDKSYVGASQWFVSHCWTYNFLDLVESINLFFSKRGEEDVYLYIDMFSVNQHEGSKPFEYFQNEFGPAVGSIGRTLLVTHDISSSCGIWTPEVLRRSWCVFELWATCLYNCELHVTMDMSNRTVFNNLYRSTDEFIRYLSSLKLTEAEAQKSDDRTNIESVIKSTIGYDAVHRQVFTALVEVFTKELLLITPENQVDFEQREYIALHDITHRVFNAYKPQY